VEELSLQHYCSEGGWRGLHCEGAPVIALFRLLMREILWCGDVVDAFACPY